MPRMFEKRLLRYLVHCRTRRQWNGEDCIMRSFVIRRYSVDHVKTRWAGNVARMLGRDVVQSVGGEA